MSKTSETIPIGLPNADGLKEKIPAASEAALRLYMSVSARTEGGLPGPGSIYEHGFHDGALWAWVEARKFTFTAETLPETVSVHDWVWERFASSQAYEASHAAVKELDLIGSEKSRFLDGWDYAENWLLGEAKDEMRVTLKDKALTELAVNPLENAPKEFCVNCGHAVWSSRADELHAEVDRLVRNNIGLQDYYQKQIADLEAEVERHKEVHRVYVEQVKRMQDAQSE